MKEVTKAKSFYSKCTYIYTCMHTLFEIRTLGIHYSILGKPAEIASHEFARPPSASNLVLPGKTPVDGFS